MNQIFNSKKKKKDKEERARRIIEKALQNIQKLKFGKVTIFVQNGYAFRVETTESSTGE